MTEFKSISHTQFDPILEKLPFKQTVDIVDSNFDSIDLSKTVVLFHASWSGPSILIIKRILTKLTEFELDELNIVIFNWDSYGQTEFNLKFGETVFGNGNGESIWFENEQIIYKHYSATIFGELDKFLDSYLIKTASKP